MTVMSSANHCKVQPLLKTHNCALLNLKQNYTQVTETPKC